MGPCPADILIVGEAPGFNEDAQGKPFVGQAGKLLDTLLAGIGLRREDVYITNVLKCRPPQNRDPMPNEVEACAPYLNWQLKLVEPKVVIVLGRHALREFPLALVGQCDGVTACSGETRKLQSEY